MGEVRSALEKAMEKIREVELTEQERKELKDREKLRVLLSAFYNGKLDRDEIWKRFKEMQSSLLTEAQENIADSLRLTNTPDEFRNRKEGILAIEALKGSEKMAEIEQGVNSAGNLHREYVVAKERALAQVKKAVEENPQLRVRQVRSPDGRTIFQPLPADEAVRSKMEEFLAEHEKRYEALFDRAISMLKMELRR